MLALGGQRARDDLVRGVVAAHGVDGQYRTGHRPDVGRAGTGHHQVPGPLRAARAAAPVERALGSAVVRTVRGPSLRMVRGRAQRVTQGVSGRG